MSQASPPNWPLAKHGGDLFKPSRSAPNPRDGSCPSRWFRGRPHRRDAPGREDIRAAGAAGAVALDRVLSCGDFRAQGHWYLSMRRVLSPVASGADDQTLSTPWSAAGAVRPSLLRPGEGDSRSCRGEICPRTRSRPSWPRAGRWGFVGWSPWLSTSARSCLPPDFKDEARGWPRHHQARPAMGINPTWPPSALTRSPCPPSVGECGDPVCLRVMGQTENAWPGHQLIQERAAGDRVRPRDKGIGYLVGLGQP